MANYNLLKKYLRNQNLAVTILKIKLPHRTVVIKEIDKMLTDKEKVAYVNEILKEETVVKGEAMTVENYFRDNFNNQSAIVAMDMLSYYITKEHKAKQDILTRKTVGKMQKGDGRTLNFSNLNYNENLKMGLVDDQSETDYN